MVISDTAEYGNYLFSYACVPLLKEFMTTLQTGDLGTAIAEGAVDKRAAARCERSDSQPRYRAGW